jgi:HK97 family phage major capsid protein
MALKRTTDEILESIDCNFNTMLEESRAANARAEQLRKDFEPKIAEMKALAEAQGKELVLQKEYVEKVEAQLDKARFNTGGSGVTESDSLLNALPEKVRRFASYCRSMVVPDAPDEKTVDLPRDHSGFTPGAIKVYDDDYRMGRVRTAIGRFRHADPVRYAATISWLFHVVKMRLCSMSSDMKGTQEHRDILDKLTVAMGGSPKRNTKGEFEMFPDVEERVALQENTDSEGGFLVPTLVYNVIGWLARDAEVTRSAGATVITMVGDKLELPRRTVAGAPTTQYPNEEAAFTDGYTTGPFDIVTLNASKQGAIQPLSMEVLQDEITAMGLLDFVLADFVNDMGARFDFQTYEGSGTPFTGLLNAAGVTVVPKTPAAMVPNDIIRLIYGNRERSTIDAGVIFCNPLLVRDLLLTNFGANNPAFLWSSSLSSDGFTPTVIGGKRIYTSNQHSLTLGGGTEGYWYHGDPAELWIGDRLGASFVVNPWARQEFTQAQVLCRVLRRVAFTPRVTWKWARGEDIQITP